MELYELTLDQLEELRDALYWQWLDEGKIYADYEVTDQEVYDEFSGILFVNDDFFCTAGKEEDC